MDIGEAAALLGALAALVVAVAGVLRELRLMRRDIVDAVSMHKDETIHVLQQSLKDRH